MVLMIPYIKFKKERQNQTLFIKNEVLYIKNILVKGVYVKPIASDVSNCISHDIMKRNIN